jgi:hypothetical protein
MHTNQFAVLAGVRYFDNVTETGVEMYRISSSFSETEPQSSDQSGKEKIFWIVLYCKAHGRIGQQGRYESKYVFGLRISIYQKPLSYLASCVEGNLTIFRKLS